MFKKTFALVLFAACTDQGPIEIEATEKIAGNALPSGLFAAANLSAGRLTATNLHNMASTDSGRTVLPYLIGCALGAGTTVSTTYQVGIGPETPISFTGQIGLATSWTAANLTITQQRMVSGCVMARVNALAYQVNVSLRGPATQLTVTSSEASGYLQFEGTFFGNIFAGANFELAACTGTATTLPTGRVCAQDDAGSGLTPCGFEYAGSCATACSTLVTASNHTYYTNCTIGATTYAEAVTTYVQ